MQERQSPHERRDFIDYAAIVCGGDTFNTFIWNYSAVGDTQRAYSRDACTHQRQDLKLEEFK